MRGNLRTKNRKQSQKEQLFQEQRFDTGWVNDLPASDLPKGGMALLENFVGYPEYIEGRSGSQKYSDTAMPSGILKSITQHPTSKKWVAHIGTKIYSADASQATWAEIVTLGTNADSSTINGDTSSQLSVFQLYHTTTSNSNAGTNYWNLTNSGAVRTLDVYKDSAKTQLVATGSRNGNGVLFLHQQNSSGLGGVATVTYVGNDTDIGNTFVNVTGISNSLGIFTDSHFEPYGNDFILNGTDFNFASIIYIDLTSNKFFYLSGAGGLIPAVGSQTAATPYGYRYVFSHSRVVNASTGALDSTVDRVSGTILFESATASQGGASGNSIRDYVEIWLANPITAGTANTLVLTNGTTIPGRNAGVHCDRISLYRTMDIGISGTDPVTGSGNNREIYTWVGDYDFSSEQISDAKPDDDLRAAFAAGFGLKTRFWSSLPCGAPCIIANNFIYSADRGANKVYYAQLSEKRFIGFYNPAFQFFNLDDGIQLVAKTPDMVSFICSNKTYTSNPNSYFDAGGEAIASVFVLNNLTVASENIGVTDWSSFTKMDNSFIAHCTDHTIRIWNSSYWSDDIASRRVSQIIRQVTEGSVGIYGAGAFYLFYRTFLNDTNNSNCLRYGFSRESGFGWSKVSGSAWMTPPTYAGAVQILDSNNLQRIVVYDASDTFCYWIETFTAYSGSSVTKVFKDKVATNGTGGTNIVCTARFREFTAAEESMDLFHKESYIYDRPYDEATGYPSGFSRTLRAYTDGSTTAAATITAAPARGDLQFFDKVQGNRIQMEVQFATSGARLTGIGTLCDVFDRAGIGARPSDGADAAAQLALASNLAHWVTRPSNFFDRVTGQTLTGSGTPTNVTGPDNRSYALSFTSGAYSIADTGTYNDFTQMFWVKGFSVGSAAIPSSFATFSVTFSTNTNMAITALVGGGNVTVVSIASGWHHFALTRTGTALTVYQNGALQGSATISGSALTGAFFRIGGASMQIYDIRLYSANIGAAAIAYYYADVTTTLQGKKVLPLA